MRRLRSMPEAAAAVRGRRTVRRVLCRVGGRRRADARSRWAGRIGGGLRSAWRLRLVGVGRRAGVAVADRAAAQRRAISSGSAVCWPTRGRRSGTHSRRPRTRPARGASIGGGTRPADCGLEAEAALDRRRARAVEGSRDRPRRGRRFRSGWPSCATSWIAAWRPTSKKCHESLADADRGARSASGRESAGSMSGSAASCAPSTIAIGSRSPSVGSDGLGDDSRRVGADAGRVRAAVSRLGDDRISPTGRGRPRRRRRFASARWRSILKQVKNGMPQDERLRPAADGVRAAGADDARRASGAGDHGRGGRPPRGDRRAAAGDAADAHGDAAGQGAVHDSRPGRAGRELRVVHAPGRFRRAADRQPHLDRARQIEEQLTRLTAHMETVLQKYLRNEFATIHEYNAQAGEVAEPFQVLVVANFPDELQRGGGAEAGEHRHERAAVRRVHADHGRSQAEDAGEFRFERSDGRSGAPGLASRSDEKRVSLAVSGVRAVAARRSTSRRPPSGSTT